MEIWNSLQFQSALICWVYNKIIILPNVTLQLLNLNLTTYLHCTVYIAIIIIHSHIYTTGNWEISKEQQANNCSKNYPKHVKKFTTKVRIGITSRA
jgi:hypothetical protein